jgi:Helix-turn-helix domain
MSKAQKIFNHLQKKSITGIQALELYGVYRLSSVINRFRKAGHKIETIMVNKAEETYAKYKLIK